MLTEGACKAAKGNDKQRERNSPEVSHADDWSQQQWPGDDGIAWLSEPVCFVGLSEIDQGWHGG